MIKHEDSNMFEKRKQEIVIASVEIIKTVYTSGTITLTDFLNDKKYSDIVYKYYNEGLKLISEGKAPEIVKFMLEYEKMKWIKDTNITEEDLLLITTIQGIIPYIQQIDFDGFYQLCCCLIAKPQQYSKVANLLLEINPHIWDSEDIISNNIGLAVIEVNPHTWDTE